MGFLLDSEYNSVKSKYYIVHKTIRAEICSL